MTTGADIVVEARTWLGTPFHHQARLKDIGADCAGVVIGVAHALGLSDFDCYDYGREPAKGQMRHLLNEHMDKVTEAQPGDVLLMAFSIEEQHLAILTDSDTIIHAYASAGKCVEHRYSDVWMVRTRGTYRFRGIS